jgi:hypothetical protein
MKPKGHAVLLHPNTPEVLFVMLKKDIRTYGKMKMLFASSVSYEQFGFLEVVVLATKDREAWRFSIPLQYVLAIADLPESLDRKAELGFRP